MTTPNVDALGETTASEPAKAATARAVQIDPLAATTASDSFEAASAATIDSGASGVIAGIEAAPPTRLGRYVELDRLGAGAMGVVYRARDVELGRQVALKLLKHPGREVTDRLVREARAMAQVAHPNVVAVYDVGTAPAEATGGEGATYIAMELVDGTSLREWQSQPRSVAELIAAYTAAGHGLAAAHAAGIVHRDFKPDNVLVGADGRVRVTDFGLAAGRPRADTGPVRAAAASAASAASTTSTTSAASMSTTSTASTTSSRAAAARDVARDAAGLDLQLTAAGTVLGTPAYMAPEQLTGGNVDPRSDQFGFCAALHEALYGRRPFSGSSYLELANRVCDGKLDAPPPGSRVSKALRAIVLRGLSVKPGDRFATMDHLLAELGRDRARPFRRVSAVLAAIAAALALWLVADVALRERAAVEVAAAFRLTGVQADRTLSTVQAEFFAKTDSLYHEDAVRVLAAHHDLADFGLGSESADRDDLAEIHGQIASSNDWAFAQNALANAAGTTAKPDRDADAIALVDAKGRLIYSTASSTWGTDVTTLPQVKRAIDTGRGAGVAVLAYDDPALVTTGVIAPGRPGLAVVYDRPLSLGAESEARAVLLEVVDGRVLLDKIRLDEQTRLALVAPSGISIGDAPRELTAAAPAPGAGTSTATIDGDAYEVQTLAVNGFEGQGTVATVVLANPIRGLTLFPHARLVLGLLLLVAAAGALATGLQARRMARA